ncbi:MAG: type II secretion system protein [Pseudomonadota bacterium]|jgi:type II secretory pathway pseudopilin PulG
MNRKRSLHSRTGAGARGFSLVELAVGLAVLGAIGLAVWKFLPVSRQIAEGDPVVRDLRHAQAAVEGYALRRHRLPCPDTDGDGREDCAAGALGRLPWRDLGLEGKTGRLAYGVYRAAPNDLAQAAARFTPLLPPPHASAKVNGLDLCVALRAAAAAPSGLTAGGVPAAYAVADPGPNGAFDGPNAAGFELPGRPAAPDYDDRVAAAGLAELSGRLQCPTRLGEAQAAARAAYAAYDLDRDAQQFQDFRDFAYQVRQTDTKLAAAKLGLATADMADAIGTSASAISIAANSVGVGAGVVVAAVGGIGAAAAALAAATASTVMAAIAEAKAQAQAQGAAEFRTQTAAALAQAANAAIDADTKGLTP